jgi:hypothetical protein
LLGDLIFNYFDFGVESFCAVMTIITVDNKKVKEGMFDCENKNRNWVTKHKIR